MKKLFLTICLTAMLSTPAMSACEGGTLVDDGKFCISNFDLNWWSAANWCKANGMHLATIYEVCPDWDGNMGSGTCGRTFSSINENCWTATVKDNDAAFEVTPSKGYVYFNYRHGDDCALCAN